MPRGFSKRLFWGRTSPKWEDMTAVLYRKYVSGKGWYSTEVVSQIDNDWIFASYITPTLAVGDDGTVHVAWVDYLNLNENIYVSDTRIFYNKYVPTIGWTVAKVISVEGTGSSWGPTLALDSNGAAHVAWVDDTGYDRSGADTDILYRKIPARKYVLGVIDKVDIGYPASEKGHNLWGWGPMWHGYSDVNLPKAPFNSYRAAWYSGEGTSMNDRSGIVTLHNKQDSITHIYLRVSDIESFGVYACFDVYAQASWGKSWTAIRKVYSYIGEGVSGYSWLTHEVEMPESWESANAIRISIVVTGDLATKLNAGTTDYVQLVGYIKVNK